ncbi:MAG: histidine kinase, partial [Bacteroidota bacterium]
LMRYVIYKGKEATVPIEEEIQYIEDFIQLQQLRLHQEIDFTFEKTLEQEGLPVPPLLFITFVENAFKHGIEKAEGPAKLGIKLHLQARKLSFEVVNSVETIAEHAPGIGLENLKNRLALQYSGRHEITTQMDGNQYRAQLKIWDL